MNPRKKILAINGSYRDDGVTDQTLRLLVEAVESAGAQVDVVVLRDQPIEFCLNCRQCTQQPGSAPGQCVLNDGMQTLIDKIEQADGYILASPTNFGSVTGLFKRFMERLIVYAYWPWKTNIPRFRKASEPKKKALLVSSCGAPGFLGRWVFGTHKQLKTTAQTIGADVIGTMFTGLIAHDPEQRVPKRVHENATALAKKLL